MKPLLTHLEGELGMVFHLEGQNKDMPSFAEDKGMGDQCGNQNHLDSGDPGVVCSEGSQDMARSVHISQAHTARNSWEDIHQRRKKRTGMASSDQEAGADNQYCRDTN